MQGGSAHAARRLRLAERPVHGVEQAERLDRAVLQITAVALERHDAPDVDVPEIHRRMAVDDPVGEHLAGAARRLDADRIEAGGDEQVADFRRLAEEIAVIGREALRPVEEQLDAGLPENRDAANGGLEQRLDMLQILGQLVEGEALGNPVHAPGLGDRLEPADQQLAGVLLEVGASIRVAQHRQVARQLRDRLGDDVEMLGGVQRHRGAGLGGEPMRPHAGRIDHELRLDVALCRAHARGAAVLRR